MALSTRNLYSGICAALKMSEGLVVASCGANCLMRREIAGVGDDGGEFLELVELVKERPAFRVFVIQSSCS